MVLVEHVKVLVQRDEDASLEELQLHDELLVLVYEQREERNGLPTRTGFDVNVRGTARGLHTGGSGEVFIASSVARTCVDRKALSLLFARDSDVRRSRCSSPSSRCRARTRHASTIWRIRIRTRTSLLVLTVSPTVIASSSVGTCLFLAHLAHPTRLVVLHSQ